MTYSIILCIFYINKKSILFPYFSYGTAGISYVVLHYLTYSKDDILEKYLDYLINGLKITFSVHLGFEKGLVGIFYVLFLANKLGYTDNTTVDECYKNIVIQLVRIEHSLFFPSMLC